MKQDNNNVKISIPKVWFQGRVLKKALPFILTAILSSSGVAGFETVTRDGTNYTKQIEEMSTKYEALNSRLGNAESINQSILVQLSDIKDQNIRTQALVENVLLKMAR